MLYDKRWDRTETKPDVLSIESLVAWLEKRNPAEEYDYENCRGGDASTGYTWPRTAWLGKYPGHAAPSIAGKSARIFAPKFTSMPPARNPGPSAPLSPAPVRRWHAQSRLHSDAAQ